MTHTPKPAPPPAPRQLSNPVIAWGFTPPHSPPPPGGAGARVALVVAWLATLSISLRTRRIIDHGFGSQADNGRIGFSFELMLLVATVLGIATAVRFYFVSWIGERTVADMRIAVQRNLLSLPPKWFEENRPAEIASRPPSATAIA